MRTDHTPKRWQVKEAFVNNSPNIYVITTGEWGAPNIATCADEDTAHFIVDACRSYMEVEDELD